MDNALNICKTRLDNNGICTIVIHPQDFFNYQGQVDENKYNQFLALLDSLKELNAEPKTFKNLIVC